ncbi:MAG: response regulator [Desulfobulbaceae bacterium]|nr:response regulator [Desulfobulbaceae bacterium]MCK5322944.1 response regulator [Desulfobulbaceae bacterium]MCK5543565.1 response regulator [Desulfobulbaceae bacterium]
MKEKNYRILVVDDQIVILKTIAAAFKDTSYKITTVRNPVEAYQMIEDEQFDIVISDIRMPKMNGLDLLRKIKNHNGMIPVIMITGYTTINNILNAFRYGAFDFFFKPVAQDEIVSAVDRAAAKIERVNSLLAQAAEMKDGA